MPDDDAALGEAGLVEGVQGLAGLEHDVIGDVDDVVDGPDAGGFETALHPVGGGADLDALEDAGAVAGAVGGVLDVDAGLGGDVAALLAEGDVGEAEGRAGEGGDFAGDADEGELVGAVGGDFEVEDGLGLAEYGGQRGAGGEGGIEDHEAGVVGADAELVGGAKHAAALDAADLALFDFESARQLGAEGREGVRPAGLDVGRAAHDDGAFGGAVVHGAQVQVVAVGVGLDVEDLGDDDARGRAADLFDAFDLDAGKHQPVHQLPDRQLDVHVFLQPTQRNFHDFFFLLSYGPLGALKMFFVSFV